MHFIKRLFAFNIFLFCCPIFAISQNQPAILSKTYSPVELKKDAEVLRDVLLAMHPAIGIYKSRDYYQKTFEHYINHLDDGMTEKQFRISLKILIDEFKQTQSN